MAMGVALSALLAFLGAKASKIGFMLALMAASTGAFAVFYSVLKGMMEIYVLPEFPATVLEVLSKANYMFPVSELLTMFVAVIPQLLVIKIAQHAYIRVINAIKVWSNS